MRILERVRTAAQNLAAMAFGRNGPRRWFDTWLGGTTRFNYAAETNLGTNSIVLAVVGWLARTFPEAPPRVQSRVGTELKPLPDHPMTRLLRRPNAYYSGILLWMATINSWLLDGNVYWIKIRDGLGLPAELWWVPPNMMEPAWPVDGSEFISHYEYKPDARYEPIRIEIRDVVHLRYGLDPQNPRKGCSPLKSLVREVFTDDEAANFAAALLRNLGVPGLVISPDTEAIEIGPEDAKIIKADAVRRFTGDNRGEPLVLAGKSKVQVLSFSPKDMDLTALRRIPEERVTAVTGIPAIVAGLGAGLDASTYSNYAQAREAAYESNVIPTQRLFAEELRVQLLSEYGDINKLEFDFDLSNVRVLQDDQNKLVERMTRRLVNGGISLNSYLRQLGEEEEPNGDVYYIPKNVIPTKPDKLNVAPEPLPIVSPETRPLPTPPTPSRNGQQNGHVPELVVAGG